MWSRFLPQSFVTRKPFLLYTTVLFFIALADAVMSYTAPILIERAVGSATMMGIVFAVSSLAGMIVDFTFARLFGNKRSGFFLRILCSLVVLFPLSLIVLRIVPSFLFAMVVWGVYFEAMVFANFHSVHEHLSPIDHAWGWGILSVFRNLSLVLGPFIASLLFEIQPTYALVTAISLYAIGIGMFLISGFLRTGKHTEAKSPAMRRSTRQEFRLWGVFERRLWPLITLLLLFYFVDTAFLTTGPLLAEKLKDTTAFGSVFVSLYALPDLILGFFAAKLAQPFGKKRMAFGAGIVAGIGLMVMGWSQSLVMLFVGNIITAISLGVMYPELQATFEDYICRCGKFGNDLIGLTAIACSIPYVIGPIANGLIIDQSGERAVFGAWGTLIFVFCIALFFIVPRKVRMPEQALEQVLSS